jgi:hypothetical protein
MEAEAREAAREGVPVGDSGARDLGPYARRWVDSYDRTLPFGGPLADALVFPPFYGGNMGVGRRQLHEATQTPDYDRLAAAGN